ncbi:MAG: HlyD family efflux transporter periplasmic adaptor subunit [Planctomycetota bacterium]
MFRQYLMPVLAVFGIGFAMMHAVTAQQEKPVPPPPVEPARSPFGKTIAGTGLVEPTTENISIGTPVPGVVLEVAVKVGQTVKAGQPLFRLDDRQWKADRQWRKATLASAQSKLARLESMPRPEEIPPLEAKVREAQVNVTFEKNVVNRTRNLVNQKALADEELDRREQAYRMSEEQLAKVRGDLELLKAGAWEPERAVARAEVAQAQAALVQTETEIERLFVRAPVDGEVLQVNVRPGEYAGTPASKALIVLGDVVHLHLRVDVDEHDIFRFDPTAPAFAHVRGNVQQKYPLTFVRVEPYVVPKKSLTGDASERVDSRVLQVIYAVSVSESVSRLYVGQQMDVFIEAKAR